MNIDEISARDLSYSFWVAPSEPFRESLQFMLAYKQSPFKHLPYLAAQLTSAFFIDLLFSF